MTTKSTTTLMLLLNCILTLAISIFPLSYACAANSDDSVQLLQDTLSDDLVAILADEYRNRVYVADAANKSLLVIDGGSLGISRVKLPGVPHALA